MRPDNIKNMNELPTLTDVCGELKELYSSENQSLAYFIVKGKAGKHKHEVMEEVYHIVKGEGYITIEDAKQSSIACTGNGTFPCDKYPVSAGDTISIPKGKWHYLETETKLELMVVTYPRFMPEDVIEE